MKIVYTSIYQDMSWISQYILVYIIIHTPSQDIEEDIVMQLCWMQPAEWIGENMQEELGFPDKADKRAQPGTGWTPAELNRILQDTGPARGRW